MKKNLQVFAFIVTTIILANGRQAIGQVPCSLGLYQTFGDASKQTPVVLNRLGTSPQFGEIPKHTAEAAFTHLAKVHKRNSRNSRNEIDTFLKALGYSGLKDPAFTVSKITPSHIPAGQIGWMGAYSKGHKYKWSVLGREFETFKITSIDGTCHAYIMKKCGNVFYQPPPPPQPIEPEKPVAFCKPQTLNFIGKGKIQAGDVINTKKIFTAVASFNGNNLCVGDLDVPVRLTYDITASGDVNYSKMIEVCDYGNGVPATVNYNLPLEIKYKTGFSEVNVGEDGKMNLAVNKKQYKSLKKVYKICPNTVASSSTANCVTDPALKVNTASVASPSVMVGGGKPGECVKQTLSFTGSAKTEDVSSKITTQEVTLIGAYKKMGKLQKGETADKFMCLGTYSVPAKSCLQYAINGTSTYDQIIEVCDNGSVNPNEKITLPFSMKSNITKQEVMVGDYGKVYMSLTKKQYKKLSKAFKRCCSDGSKGKC